MLAEWQASVGEQLDRLRPALAELEPLVGSDPSHPASAPLREARRNFDLVALDGSRGAHNVTYALDALRAAAERLDRVRELVGEPQLASLAGELPFRSAHGCSACHSGLGRPAEVTRAEDVFPHSAHLASGLDCDSCHSLERHGEASFPREQCASCHHRESEERDVSDCASCHAAQQAMLRGTVAELAEPKPGGMSEMECGECHGEAPKILRPKPQYCVLCHEDGYDDLARTWNAETAAGVARVEKALEAARLAGGKEREIARARSLLESVEADGSGGAHNFDLAKFLLEEAANALSAP
jgi:hypothetical protein